MTPENFAYWLQGFFEIHGAGESLKESLDINQVRMIKEHLALVHKKVTSSGKDNKLSSLEEMLSKAARYPDQTVLRPTELTTAIIC